MTRLLADHPDISAAVAMHNTTAVGAINAIQAAGRTVPDDCSVIGIAFGTDSDLITPSLTAIHWDAQAIGRDAARMLIRGLDRPSAPSHQELVPPRLVMRRSTASHRSIVDRHG